MSSIPVQKYLLKLISARSTREQEEGTYFARCIDLVLRCCNVMRSLGSVMVSIDFMSAPEDDPSSVMSNRFIRSMNPVYNDVVSDSLMMQTVGVLTSRRSIGASCRRRRDWSGSPAAILPATEMLANNMNYVPSSVRVRHRPKGTYLFDELVRLPADERRAVIWEPSLVKSERDLDVIDPQRTALESARAEVSCEALQSLSVTCRERGEGETHGEEEDVRFHSSSYVLVWDLGLGDVTTLDDFLSIGIRQLGSRPRHHRRQHDGESTKGRGRT